MLLIFYWWRTDGIEFESSWCVSMVTTTTLHIGSVGFLYSGRPSPPPHTPLTIAIPDITLAHVIIVSGRLYLQCVSACKCDRKGFGTEWREWTFDGGMWCALYAHLYTIRTPALALTSILLLLLLLLLYKCSSRLHLNSDRER